MKKNTFSVLVENEPGILTRITSLFTRRGFVYNSITFGPCERKNKSRITIVTPGDERKAHQIRQQLLKLVNVVQIDDLTLAPSVQRELLLIKVKYRKSDFSIDRNILDLTNLFRAKIVDVGSQQIIIEFCGDPGKVAAFLKLISNYQITQINRTGRIGIFRDSNIDTPFINNAKGYYGSENRYMFGSGGT